MGGYRKQGKIRNDKIRKKEKNKVEIKDNGYRIFIQKSYEKR